MRCMVECILIKVLQLVCWPMTLSHHWLLITHTPLVAGNLPVKLWLLGDGQKVAILLCMYYDTVCI